jgi:GDP-L-fucose synthase
MILVTGGSGLLGRTLQKYLKTEEEVLWLESSQADLRDKNQVEELFDFYNPSTVIHMAAKVGGILSNSKFPYDYYLENVLMNTHVINECVKRNSKIIAISSTCVYPTDNKNYPLKEKQLHDGPAEPTNFAYAYAKRMMDVQLDAAEKSYGLESSILYLGNLYGEFDEYQNTEKAHLVPTLISKFHEAKETNKPEIELYGNGKPLRQFTLTDDISKVICKMLNNFKCGRFNVACPDNLTISEIANTIKEVVGYDGKIYYNGKLNGMHRKDVDCSRLLKHYSDVNFTPLKEGVKLVYDKVKDSLLCGS